MNEYTTSDMGLIAALYVLGLEASQIDSSDPYRVTYHFPDPDGLTSRYASMFDRNELMVPAQQYFIQIRILKKRFYEQRHRHNSGGKSVG